MTSNYIEEGFFYANYNIPAHLQQEWWARISAKVQKALDNKRSTVAMAIKVEFLCKYNTQAL